MTSSLSRREREIMEIVYAKGGATAADIHENLADPPGRGAVRKLIQILEAKGHLKHAKQGREHVYQPVRPKQSAAKKALQSLLDTFFGGNLSDAVATHLTGQGERLSEEELSKIAGIIRTARNQKKDIEP